MRRARSLLRFVAISRAAAALLTAAVTVVTFADAVSGCSSKSSLVGAGGECFLATDCMPGLVCVEQANKARVCSDDLTRVAGRLPPEGGAGNAADEGGRDAQPQPDAPPPPPDTGVPDTNQPPPDTGPPPPVDSGGD